MQQQVGALQVAQELVAQARTFGRAFDQAGDVGDHEAAVLGGAHHAEVGREGGEGVVRHLGLGRRHRADEGGLAGVGHAEQADVGQHLQFQVQREALAFLAHGLLPRRTVGAGLEVDVAQAAAAAAGEQDLLAVLVEVGDQLAGFVVGDDGADREAQRDVLAALAIAFLAAAVLAALGAEAAGVAVVDQGVEVAVGHAIHAAAAAAVAAAGAALGNELLAAEGGHAIAAVTGKDVDAGFVEKFHSRSTSKKKKALPAR